MDEGIGSRNSLAELMVRFGQKSRVNPDLEKDSWTPSCNITVKKITTRQAKLSYVYNCNSSD